MRLQRLLLLLVLVVLLFFASLWRRRGSDKVTSFAKESEKNGTQAAPIMTFDEEDSKLHHQATGVEMPSKTKGVRKKRPLPTNGKKKKKNSSLDPIPRKDWARLDNHTCIRENSSGSAPSWQTRVPFAVILGSMKAGTTALWQYLIQHPEIVATQRRESHFFDLQFKDFATPHGIRQGAAQQAYRHWFQHQLPPSSRAILLSQNSSSSTTTSLKTIDDSPRYLFWSDRIPHRLLCVAPWVHKLLCILRNPVERAYSHYSYTITENFRGKSASLLQQTFEEWIQIDLANLVKAGVVSNDTSRSERQEQEAWKTYLRSMKDQTYAILGKGLYVIQLQQWFDALEEHNLNISKTLLVLESNQLLHQTEGTLNQVADFLGLPPTQWKDTSAKHTGNYKEKMNPETKEFLERFFQPYNQRLYKLLGWEETKFWK